METWIYAQPWQHSTTCASHSTSNTLRFLHWKGSFRYSYYFLLPQEGETLADLIQRYVARYGDESGKVRVKIQSFSDSHFQGQRLGRE